MGLTALRKIINAHVKTVLLDGSLVLKLDQVWGHEITTPNAIIDARARGLDFVFNPNMVKAMIDHVTPAKDTLSAIQGQIMRGWAHKHGIEFLDIGNNGVCHAIIPERGWVRPGIIAIMGDSHTCTHGAFNAFTAGVGTTELEAAIITGLWVCPPQKVIRVNFTGNLPENVFSKDLILSLIKKIGVSHATNAILEFGGSVIDKMNMEPRMTVTNMAVEAGATSGMMAVDEETIRYLWPALKNEFSSPADALAELSQWNSDPDCEYDEIIEIDVSNMVPVVTINYSPGDVVPVSELAGTKVDQVYIGSCTNGRYSDLRIAASIFQHHGGKIADGVRCIVVPATTEVYRQAMREGLLDIFMDAGCSVQAPTCGACLGMSCGVLAPGEKCLATSNRNFSGRMGKGGMVHLASPATAAMTAIKGAITQVEAEIMAGYGEERTEIIPSEWEDRPVPEIDYQALITQQPSAETDFSGQPFFLDGERGENVNTDQIIPAMHLTETNKDKLGKHCLEEVSMSPEERITLGLSQIFIAGENFGCGSSREHAPWALEAAGIKCVIAPSFARIFYNNMFYNGLLCIKFSDETIETLFEFAPEKIEVIWDTPQGKPGQIVWGDLKDISAEFPLTEWQKELIRKGGLVNVMLEIAAELQIAGKES